jgi:hypothetical protein
MSQMPWYCPGCAGEQLFEQFHTDAGHCPEWACCACGTALIVGFLPQEQPLREHASGRSGRAA